MEKNTKVCVTGGASYLGSLLVMKLLQKVYTVHSTIRNIAEPVKVGLLTSLPGADTRLRLFEANIYNPEEFEQAIQGCEYVFHLATPLQHNPQSSQFKDTSEAAIAALRSIVESCIRSGTVKRLIYTASVVAASPLKDDGFGFKDSMDESCWTPLNLELAYNNSWMTSTLAEREVLKDNGHELEIVILACGLVGGNTLQSYMPESMGLLLSQITNNKMGYSFLRMLEEMLGKVPIMHVEDVCEAHIFCMEKSSISGRFLCASTSLRTVEIASYWQKHYPNHAISEEFIHDSKREIVWGSTKLREMGFEFNYDVKMLLDDSIKCALRISFKPEFSFPETYSNMLQIHNIRGRVQDSNIKVFRFGQHIRMPLAKYEFKRDPIIMRILRVFRHPKCLITGSPRTHDLNFKCSILTTLP